MNASPAGWQHVPQLDAMRASAIIIVMLSHAGLQGLVPGGFGVTIFFFLSGYLITTLMRLEAASTGRLDLPGFYFRRTVRIVPPLALALLLAVLLQAAGLAPMQFTPSGLAADAAFLTNYAHLWGISSAVPIPLWSLNVEEHFYVGFSTLFAICLAKRSPRMGAACCAAGCAVILSLRFAHALGGGNLEQIYYLSHTRMDSILFGCILALWNNPLIDEGAWRPGPLALAAAVGVLLASLLVRDEIFRHTLRYTLQGIALLVVASWLLRLGPSATRAFSSRPMQWMALLSYTLYLVHLPLLAAAERLGLTPAWLWGYLSAFAYALASYLWIERPLGRWRRQYEKRLTKGDDTAIAAL